MTHLYSLVQAILQSGMLVVVVVVVVVLLVVVVVVVVAGSSLEYCSMGCSWMEI